MILEARGLSLRLRTVTLVANLVRYKASSRAASPPPMTATSLPLKKNPSQVAQDETPLPRSRSSDGNPSQSEEAPVAIITLSAIWSSWPAETLNGLWEKLTFVR